MSDVYTENLESYFPEDAYQVMKVTDSKLIISHLSSQAETHTCRGKIGKTGYYLLAFLSPVLRGDKAGVFVCQLDHIPVIEKPVPTEVS